MAEERNARVHTGGPGGEKGQVHCNLNFAVNSQQRGSRKGTLSSKTGSSLHYASYTEKVVS